ncbi:MAG: tetratricopeptide repeat protein [Candidatus Latescibacteria bacterium]|nr:tetratricopeptide repeat protein [Candidatus Latescibacterota bacterium]MBT4140581.1 tetratricopeptide repeat protein [Candidatus Latescibacterota bacterium]MBT5832006.1 tetratricopeptide repeat protein [Candidatus Latescibacterota bacterium]
MADHTDISALIGNLTELQKDLKVEDILAQALSEPMPTEERLRQVEQALETFKSLGLLGGEDARDLHLLLTLGRTYERLSHLEKAYETYETALKLAERHNDDASKAELLSQMGRVLTRWQRWDEAMSYLEQSSQVYEKLGDVLGQVQTIVRRGTVYSEQGNYEAAQEVYEQALRLGERIDDKKTIARVNNNMAILATIQGNLNEAITQYEACLVMYAELGDERGMASAYHNLGMTHADQEDWTSAMDAYEKGFEAAQKSGHLDIMANVHLSMAEVMLEMGNSMMVPMCCARALDIYRKTGDRLGEADAYRLLARTFGMRKDWDTANQLFKDSLTLNEEHSNPLGIAETQRDWGNMLVDRGLKTDAQHLLEVARDGFIKLGAQADVKKVENALDELKKM